MSSVHAYVDCYYQFISVSLLYNYERYSRLVMSLWLSKMTLFWSFEGNRGNFSLSSLALDLYSYRHVQFFLCKSSVWCVIVSRIVNQLRFGINYLSYSSIFLSELCSSLLEHYVMWNGFNCYLKYNFCN